MNPARAVVYAFAVLFLRDNALWWLVVYLLVEQVYLWLVYGR